MSYQKSPKTVKNSLPDTPNAWSQERLAALRAVRAWECGSRLLWRISRQTRGSFQRPETPEEWRTLELTDNQKERFLWSQREPLEPLVGRMGKEDIRFLLASDAEYPRELLNIPDPPFALFVRGAPLTDTIRLAVVGTRRMSSYGRRCADFFGSELGHAGLPVVSGLAAGIDAESHKAAVRAGGTAVAVLPGGVDDASIAPQANLPLALEILARGGSLVSEHAPGSDIKAYSFLYRNRIIAGLANAVLVVEGDHGSGALVTARLALEQGREVLAVPGPIWSRSSCGPNRLLADGARVCEGMRDIWDALGMDERDAKRISEVRETLPGNPEEERLLALCTEERTADELVRMSGFTPQTVASALSLLELKGRVLSVGPKTFLRAP